MCKMFTLCLRTADFICMADPVHWGLLGATGQCKRAAAVFCADWMVKHLMHGAIKRLYKEWLSNITQTIRENSSVLEVLQNYTKL